MRHAIAIDTTTAMTTAMNGVNIGTTITVAITDMNVMNTVATTTSIDMGAAATTKD